MNREEQGITMMPGNELEIAKIPIHRAGDRFALVDAEDLQRVLAVSEKWYMGSGYAMARVRGENRSIAMHRLIMNPPQDMVVDHINEDRLDNRKCNLRVCSVSQNNRTLNRYVDALKTRDGFVSKSQEDNSFAIQVTPVMKAVKS